MRTVRGCLGIGALALVLFPVVAQAQAQAQVPSVPPVATAGVVLPADYLIGPDDVLTVRFWKDQDMSSETVIVRPDGKVSLPLINDIQAAGLTPEQLRTNLNEAASKWVRDPNALVLVKEIRSRRVFITGQVAKPGPYPLGGPTTVLQLIALAGGLQEFADGKNIAVIRNEKGQQASYRFNYADVLKRRNLKQNIELKPGDTVLVP